MPTGAESKTLPGGCHCGGVRFEVDVSQGTELSPCNCSICRRTGYVHLIVARDRFRLLQGADLLTSYRFNTGKAEHLFCSVCGIKSFYVPRSHPDGYSVNARCLEGGVPEDMPGCDFDGQHWEQAARERQSGATPPPVARGGSE